MSGKNEEAGGCPDPRLAEEGGVYFGYRKVPRVEKRGLVVKHFDTVARKYDWMNTVLSFGLHHLWKRAAVGMLKLEGNERVLDVCGGTADLTILAAKAMGPAGRVTLYDLNRAMMEKGKEKLKEGEYGARIDFVQGDAERIALTEGSFDVAMVGFGIRNLTDMEQGFREMYRVLGKGGRFLCLEFSQPAAPVFRWLYDVYSFHIMPLVGQLLAGSRQAYTYLPESIRMFPISAELTQILEGIGFVQVGCRRFTNGIAAVHTGIKP